MKDLLQMCGMLASGLQKSCNMLAKEKLDCVQFSYYSYRTFQNSVLEYNVV